MTTKKAMSKAGLAVLITGIVAAGCSSGSASGSAAQPSGSQATAASASPAASVSAAPSAAGIQGEVKMLVADNLIESKETTEKLLKQFEDKNPTVKVKLETVPASQIYEKLKILISTDEMPDIYQMQVSNDLAGLANQGGYVYDLKQLSAAKNFSPAVQQDLTRDGKMVDFALGQGVLGFLYNKKMFADAGFANPPATWDELKKLGDALKASNKALLVYSGKWATGTPNVFHWTFGNRALQDTAFAQSYKTSTIDFAKPENMATLKEGYARFNELNKYVLTGSFTNEYEQARQAFVGGQAAMMMGGTWDAGSTDKLNPSFEWAFMNLPYGPADQNSTVYTVEAGISLNAKSKNLEASKALMEFLFSKDVYAQIVKAKKSLSAMPGVGEVDPRFADAAKRLDGGKVMPFVNGGPMAANLITKLGQTAQAASFDNNVDKAATEFIKEYNIKK